MNDWYRPPIPPVGRSPGRWKLPAFSRQTRRLLNGLCLAFLLAFNTIQPAMAIAAPPVPQESANGTDFMLSAWRELQLPAGVANYFANEPSGTITNTVSVGSTTTDPNPVNNTAVQTTTVTSEADLLISKSDGLTDALPGTVITYTIVVTNAGPSAVTNAPVDDNLPAAITSASWSCGASSGSSCGTSSGNGDIATTVDLPVGGTATFTVVASLSPTATGTVVNTALVSPPINTTDPNPDNNDDTDTDNLLTGVLTGTVYLDGNGSAGYDGGEGLSGITIVITTSVGYVFTTTTDANGSYAVTVPAGDTIADVTDSELPTGVVQIEGDDATTVTVPAGGSAGSVDGYEQQGQVTGHVYRDTNGDGNQDPGEPDLPNVLVVITDTFGVAQTVTTDANGNYTATVPIGGTTADVIADVIEATLPPGSVQTEGTDPTTVTATPGNSVSIGIDGYQPQGLVDGTVYMDENGDGVYVDGVDTPLDSVTVVITDSNGVVYTVTTNANGYFSQTVPSGDTIVDIDNDDLDPNVVLTGGSSDPTTVTVPGGGTVTDDTGYVLLASIGDTIWLDLNGDGTQDANEPGLADIQIELTLPGGGTRTTTTGPNGNYTFDDLVPGIYTVSVVVATLPTGVLQTYDPDATADHQHTVTIASDSQYTEADFGYQGNASLGDLVWLDSDGDGVRDLGAEVGIPGVVLTLTMASGWEITTTTSAGGLYAFGGLISGTYTVTVDTNTLPVGSVLTTANQPFTYALSDGEDYELADFGYQRQAEVTGHIFEDTNGNTVQDSGEPNLPNVTVVITDSLGLTQSVTTDANGDYTATVPVDSVTAPTDTVTVDVDETTLPTGVVQTAGTDPESVEVTAGTTADAGDDGYQIQGLVEGTVYEDTNLNGAYDGGDLPLSGVDVVITDSNGDTYTVTTNGAGYFSQVVPAGSTAVNVADDDVAAINSNLMIENGFTDPTSVNVPGGDVGTTNFPYVEPLTIDKDVTTPNVIAGEQVSYEIVLRNNGGLALTNVTISDALPVSFTYSSHVVTALGASRTATTNPTVGDTAPTWGAWTINAGGALTIALTADVDSGVAAGTYDNTASANSDQTAVVNDDGTAAQDPNTPLAEDPENDEDVTITTQADLAVTKIDDPDPVVAGGVLTYTIQVVNNGPSDAQDVVVSDDLDDETSFVSASPGCNEVAGTVTCNLGTVANGAVVDITIVVTVAPDLIAYGGNPLYYARATDGVAPAVADDAIANSAATSAPMVSDALALAQPSPLVPETAIPASDHTLYVGGGGGGPGSPGVSSGLTAAPVGHADPLSAGGSIALHQHTVEGQLGLTTANALSRDGPPSLG